MSRSFTSPELSICSWSVDRSSGGMNGFLALLGEASGELLFSVWFVSSRKATRGFGIGSLSLLGFVSVSVEVSNSFEALSFLDWVSCSMSSLSSRELLRDRLLGDRRFLGPAGLLNWSWRKWVHQIWREIRMNCTNLWCSEESISWTHRWQGSRVSLHTLKIFILVNIIFFWPV